MTIEQAFITHYKRFHDYMDKSNVLLGLYPTAHEKKIFESWKKCVPREVDCIIRCLNIKDSRILKVMKEWETPCQNRKLVDEIVDQNVQCHFVADITYLFWRYADVVGHLREQFSLRESKVLLEQTIVSACTAYECFLKELIPWILANNSDCARKFLGSVNRPIKELGKYDFDPLANVALVYEDIYGKKLMPVFPDVFEFYRDILKINILDDEKYRKHLEIIFQMRHCIIHNAGKPDEEWTRKTKNAPFRIDWGSVRTCFKKIHNALHCASMAIYKAMCLDETLAPWTREGGVLVCRIDEIEKASLCGSGDIAHKTIPPNNRSNLTAHPRRVRRK